jgi:hypothetical protein
VVVETVKQMAVLVVVALPSKTIIQLLAVVLSLMLLVLVEQAVRLQLQPQGVTQPLTVVQ